MPQTTESVDTYLRDGCGRCDRYRTSACKVHTWSAALAALRDVLRETELTETVKWGAPCYTLGGKNVLRISATNDFASLGFFKGSLLRDPDGVLVPPGPSSQAVRLLVVRSAEDVAAHRERAVRFIAEAIALERAGAKVDFREAPEPVPDELRAALDADPGLQAAFEALTPGRQRSHILHVGRAKTSAARERRVRKCIPKIREGKGFLDR